VKATPATGARRYQPKQPAAPSDPNQLAVELASRARALGFARVGFAAIERFSAGAGRLERWLAAGHGAEMDYLKGGSDRADAQALLPGARSIIAVALPYSRAADLLPLRRAQHGPALGRVARYALGSDYHRVIKEKLHALQISRLAQ
jgi:epoxyqueuosine reductase